MITAVDTSVLLDVFGSDPRFGPASKAALRQALAEGAVRACEVVWAELGAAFPNRESLIEAMDRLGTTFDPLSRDAALDAADAWRSYRRRGGKRTRVIADFLIGACAHARTSCDQLLTRDRAFFRGYFDDLVIRQPG